MRVRLRLDDRWWGADHRHSRGGGRRRKEEEGGGRRRRRGEDLAELNEAKGAEPEDGQADARRHNLGMRVSDFSHQLQKDRRRRSSANPDLSPVAVHAPARAHSG